MIRTETRGPVLVLELSHGRANAFDLELSLEMEEAFAEFERSSAAKAAVVTGTGRIFSAGVDLLRVLEGGASYAAEFLPALSRSLAAVFFARKPVVAAVNGHAVAGGCLLAAACDRRLMARGDGRIGVPERLVGVPFPALALEILRFTVPPGRLGEVAYLGRTYAPEEGLALGLVDEVVEAGDLLSRAVEAAEKLSAAPGPAFELTKAQLRRPARDFLDRHAAAIDEDVARAWAAPEAAAAIRAYVEKTLKKK